MAFGWAAAEIAVWWWRPLTIAALYTLPGLALLALLWPASIPLCRAERLCLAVGLSAALPPLLLLWSGVVGLRWGPWVAWAYLLASAAVLTAGSLRSRLGRGAPAESVLGQNARGRERVHAMSRGRAVVRGRALTSSLRYAVLSRGHVVTRLLRPGREPGEARARGRSKTEVDGKRARFAPTARHLGTRAPGHPGTVTSSSLDGWWLLGISLAALLVRLYAARSLAVGLLGDSFQHTMMAQLLVDHGGLFRSWQPYAPLATFTYHFGFHANVALAHWLTGAGVPGTVVWLGQVLNALAVPLSYVLATRVLRLTPRAALWSAAIVGFGLTLPAGFINWGRYTQLTGQIVLVPLLVVWAALAEHAIDGWRGGFGRALLASPRLLALAALLLACQILTHYLVTLLAALFVAAYLLALGLRRAGWRDDALIAGRAGLAAAGGLLLTLPWLLNLANGYLVRNADAFVSGGVSADRIAGYAALPNIVPVYASGPALLLAFLGCCAALWRREWRAALPAAWSALLVVAVSPQVVGLPGAGIIDSLTGLNPLYLTLPPLAGYALALGEAKLVAASRSTRTSWLGRVPGVVALLALVGTTAGWQSQIASATPMVTPADLTAAAWIGQNTPPDARFLVNSFPAYGGTIVAGTDAGMWLPLLAGRAVTVPPSTYGSERGDPPDLALRVNKLAAALRGRPLTEPKPSRVEIKPKHMALLRASGVTYVYCGASAVPGPDIADQISVEKLRANPLFELVYDAGGVQIFRLR